MKPRVSIIWLNYNSQKIINTAKASILGIKNFDYTNYEVILLDNGSQDGSFEEIKKYVKKIKLDAKIINNNINTGFSGGNNIAYQYKDQSSKYVALINSDLVPYPESLGKFVEIMESDNRIGSIQGTIFNHDGSQLMSSGCYLDESLSSYPNIAWNSLVERSISYAEGSYCLININAIKSFQSEYIFDKELFAYFEDALLGVKLWNFGFKVLFTPVIGGNHFVGVSSNKNFKRYSHVKNLIALHRIIKTRYGVLFGVKGLTLDFIKYALSFSPELSASSYMKAISEGIRIGSILKSKGIKLKLHRAPYIKLKAHTLIMPRRKIKVSFDDIQLPHILIGLLCARFLLEHCFKQIQFITM